MDEETLRRLWEVTIPGAELEGLDPGQTFKPPGHESTTLDAVGISTVWVTDDPLDVGGVDDSMANDSVETSEARLSPSDVDELAATLGGADSGSDSNDLAATLEGSAELLETQDPITAATLLEPPPSSALAQSAQSANLPPQAGTPLSVFAPPPERRAPDPGAVYELKEVIGRGGMGVVYRARQTSLQRDVAIKTIKSQRAGQQWQDRFRAEAVVTGRLDHPNIVPVYDLGQNQGGEAMLAMKLVEGTSWKRLLHPKTKQERARAAQVDLPDQLRIFLGVCNAIAFAHSRGLIHNDLKPDNIMLGEFGEVLVMDWGLAVDFRDDGPPMPGVQHKSAVKAPCGTPSYMAPELAEGRGEAMGPWTDVYLLGAILFEVVTGRPPHKGVTFQEVVMTAVLSSPKSFPDDVPAELAAISRKAMSRHPEDRYQAIEPLRTAVEDYLEHRESRRIADEAARQMRACQEALTTRPASELARNALYADFASAVAGFHQALLLWPANPEGKTGERAAQLAYARAALSYGDLGLAEAQLASAPREPESDAIRAEIARTRSEQAEARRSAQRVKSALAGAVAVVLVTLGLGFFLVRGERDQAQRERSEAISQRSRADWEATQAKSARAKAEQERRRAEERLARSLVAEGAGLGRVGRWKEARERFEQARQVFTALGASALPAELGLWSVIRGSRPALLEISAHAGPASQLAFTSDERLLSGGDDGQVHVWDRTTGRRLQTLETGGAVTALHASPVDPNLIATGGPGGAIKLWDLTQATLIRTLQGHQARVTALHFSREGQRLFSAGADAAVLRWSLDPTRPPRPDVILGEHQAPIRGLADFHFWPGRMAHQTADHALSVDADGRLVWNYMRPPDEPPRVGLFGLSGVTAPRSLELGPRPGVEPRCLALTRDFPQRVAIGNGDHTVWIGLYQGQQGWSEEHVLRGHSAAVEGVAWSPNGKLLVSAGGDDRLVVWDAETGQALLESRDHEGGAAALAISPSGDRLACGNQLGAIRLWDLGLASGEPTGAKRGRELNAIPLSEGYRGTAAALSPDGTLLVVAEHGQPKQEGYGDPPPPESPLTIWDTESGRQLAVLHGHAAPIVATAFLDGGERIVSADERGTVRLWQIDDDFGLPNRTIETGLQGMQAAISADSMRLVVGGQGGQVRLYGLARDATPEPLWVSPQLRGAVRALAVADQGRQVLSATADGLQLWHLGRPTDPLSWSLPLSDVARVALSADATALAVGHGSGRVQLRRPGRAEADLDVMAHTDRVTGLAFSPQGLLASAGADGVWRLRSANGDELRAFGEEAPSGSLSGLTFASDGEQLVTLGRTSAEVWSFGRLKRYEEVAALGQAAQARLQQDPRDPDALVAMGELYAFRGSLRTAIDLFERARQAGAVPDPLELAKVHWELGLFGHALEDLARAPEPSGGAALARFRLWRSALERLDGEQGGVLARERDFPRRLRFSPDSTLLASCDAAGVVEVWDVQSGLLLRRLRETPAEVLALAFSPDGSRLVAGDVKGRITSWDPRTGETLAHQEHTEPTLRITDLVAFDDGRLVTSDDQRGVVLWSAEGAELQLIDAPDNEARKRPIRSLALSPDQRLVAGARQGTVVLFDLTQSARQVQSWQADERDAVQALEFAQNGQLLITGGYANDVHVWRTDSGELVRALRETTDTVYDLGVGGGIVAAATSGGTVHLWHLATGRPVGVRRRPEIFLAAAVSPDGRWLAAGTRGGLLLLSRTTPPR